jgi:hypothetical protein
LMSKALYQLGSSAPSTCGGGTVNYVNGFSEKVYLIYICSFICSMSVS